MTALEINRRIDIAAPITSGPRLTEADPITQSARRQRRVRRRPGWRRSLRLVGTREFRLRVEQADKPRLLVYRWVRETDTDLVPGNSTVVRIELLRGRRRNPACPAGERVFEELENPVRRAPPRTRAAASAELRRTGRVPGKLRSDRPRRHAAVVLADETCWRILTELGAQELSASALATRLPVSR